MSTLINDVEEEEYLYSISAERKRPVRAFVSERGKAASESDACQRDNGKEGIAR